MRLCKRSFQLLQLKIVKRCSVEIIVSIIITFDIKSTQFFILYSPISSLLPFHACFRVVSNCYFVLFSLLFNVSVMRLENRKRTTKLSYHKYVCYRKASFVSSL